MIVLSDREASRATSAKSQISFSASISKRSPLYINLSLCFQPHQYNSGCKTVIHWKALGGERMTAGKGKYYFSRKLLLFPGTEGQKVHICKFGVIVL